MRHRKITETIQTLNENAKEGNTQLENILKHQLYDKGHKAKFLSYRPMTDVRLSMEEGKIVDDFHHLVFHSIVSNIMNWPFFLDFVPIENDGEAEKEV